MTAAIFALCALTALACAALLLQAHRRTHAPLLLWSGLCFSGLFIANAVLVLDKLALPEADLQPFRLLITLGSMSVMLYGLSRSEE